jgi:hypothetical protein
MRSLFLCAIASIASISGSVFAAPEPPDVDAVRAVALPSGRVGRRISSGIRAAARLR